jgi:hypothetical protein
MKLFHSKTISNNVHKLYGAAEGGFCLSLPADKIFHWLLVRGKQMTTEMLGVEFK